jgi:Uma2 family endonuclease
MSTALAESLYEVVDDKLVEKPPMGAFEYELGSVLHEILAAYVRSRRLGRTVTETLFDLRPAVNRSRRPDVAFISAQRWPINKRAPRNVDAWPVIPNLAIEIVSPSNTSTLDLTKINEYFTSGVERVWVIYPDQSMVYDYASPTEIRVILPDGELDGGDLVPGFRLSLRELFGEPDAGEDPVVE